MKEHIRFLLILSLSFAFYNGYTQNSSFAISAYFDSYYAFDFSHPENNQRMYVTQYDRHNEFNINHAWIRGAYQANKVRVNLALQTGTYPINNYAAEPSLLQMIYEASAGYQLTDRSWLDIGVFGGHFGYESALALDRELLSPALATEYTPYYQTGIRYTNAFSEKLTFRAVVLNGWQNIAETNNSKSVGVAVDYQISDFLCLSYGNYFGNEMEAIAPKARRFHQNAIVKFTPPGNLSLIGVFDYTLQEVLFEDNDQVFFITVISDYSLNEKFSIAARYEFVKDQGAVLLTNPFSDGGSFNTQVLSMAAGFRPETNISVKVEPKFYFANNNTFGAETSVSNSAFVLNAGFTLLIGEQ